MLKRFWYVVRETCCPLQNSHLLLGTVSDPHITIAPTGTTSPAGNRWVPSLLCSLRNRRFDSADALSRVSAMIESILSLLWTLNISSGGFRVGGFRTEPAMLLRRLY
jgi:hypothetical protein